MKNVTSSHVLPFRALIDACWKEKYTSSRFVRDLIAGITVGIIAIPLAMALAIGSGVAPQYGLYTSAVAGIVIALTGGSRFSVSGPTAAFVVILYPVSQQFGLAGLLVATLMSGIFLILFGLARFGRLIEYIPLSVTLGFTSGIGITIGTMQIKDFLGLQMAHVPEHYLQSRRPSGLRKTIFIFNSLAHRTTWLHPTLNRLAVRCLPGCWWKSEAKRS